MGMRDLIIYSHTDYSDVWKPLFVSINKYLTSFRVTLFVNRFIENLNINCDQVIYDESLCYTERLKSCLEKTNIDFFLFMHEDMFLYDTPKYEYIERYFKHVETNLAKSIKLIPVGSNRYISKFDSTLYVTEYSKFSIQPTITSRFHLIDLLNRYGPKNIWEFESSIQNFGNEFVSILGSEKKRGIYHYDSEVFPYVATAIVKGKWNFSEYPKELEEVLSFCEIDKKLRGIT
jgi:hypothetical protein